MKRIFHTFFISCLLLACFATGLNAQDLSALPARNGETFNRVMAGLAGTENLIPKLAAQLMPPGQGNDEQIRYAIAGMAFYASENNQPEIKTRIAAELCQALQNSQQDEVNDFLLAQLQYVAGDESVGTVKAFLLNPRLCDPAVRVMDRINTETANQAMLEVLNKADSVCRISLVQSLGRNKYLPAINAIVALNGAPDPKLQKTVLFALSQMASRNSEKLLANAAMRAGYRFDQTNAAGAYFTWLHNLNQAGEQDFVAKISKKLIKDLKTPQQTAAKCSALELYSLAAGEKAISEITDALEDDDIKYRGAALLYSRNIESGGKMDKELLKKAKGTSPDVKAQIIRFLGEKGDPSLFPSFLEFLKTKDEVVLTATIEAMGRIGNEQAIIPVITAMNNTGTQAAVDAGKTVLLSINSEKVVSEAANAIPQVTSNAKVALIEILAQKRASAYNPVIFKYALSDDKQVRNAAYAALKNTVTKEDTEELASRLTLPLDKKEIAAIQDALYAAVKQTGNQARQAETLLDLMNKAERKDLYFRPLALAGGKKNLNIVSDSLQSKNAGMRKAASEALMEWNGPEAAPVLFSIAESQTSGRFFNEALMDYVNKISHSDINSTQKLLLLRKALDIAVRPKQKQVILEQIARTGTFTALMIVGKYIDDPSSDIRYTASQAVISIVLGHQEYYGKEVTALLNKAIAANPDPEAEYQKQAIQKHLATLPQDDGFVSLFNGKDLTGWKGLVENPIARSKMKPAVLAEKQQKANDMMRRDWKVDNGLLVYYGKGFNNLCTEKRYGDFELYVDWKIGVQGDAGIYLRGSPEVQIGDTALTEDGIQVGSGGLYNNLNHTNTPLVVADNPVNEWNTFRILMTGELVTVYLNGQLVTDHVIMENYWNRKQAIFPVEQIELQAHGSRVEYRDLYIREIQKLKD